MGFLVVILSWTSSYSQTTLNPLNVPIFVSFIYHCHAQLFCPYCLFSKVVGCPIVVVIEQSCTLENNYEIVAIKEDVLWCGIQYCLELNYGNDKFYLDIFMRGIDFNLLEMEWSCVSYVGTPKSGKSLEG